MSPALSPWHALQQRLDFFVDNQWSEPVELHPWMGASYAGTGGPDPNRQVVKTRAVFMRPGAASTGEGAGIGRQIDSKIVTSDVWISIEEAKMIIRWEDWRQGDRIYMPEGGDWYEITYIQLSATGRPQIHMTYLQPGD